MTTTNAIESDLTTTFTMPSDRELVATRVFDAQRELVWEAHVNPQDVRRWMLGPEGWTMPICEIDLRLGGHGVSDGANEAGAEMQMQGTYREILRTERIVHTEAWGDKWAETVNTTVLLEKDGKTILTCTVLYPSKSARDAALATGMKEGWSLSYERLDEHLETMKR